MLATDWDFFMPDTAIERTPLESAADKAFETINLDEKISCVEINVYGNLVGFELTAAIGDTSPETVQLELGHALVAAGQRLLQHAYFDQGERHGKFLASRKR